MLERVEHRLLPVGLPAFDLRQIVQVEFLVVELMRIETLVDAFHEENEIVLRRRRRFGLFSALHLVEVLFEAGDPVEVQLDQLLVGQIRGRRLDE